MRIAGYSLPAHRILGRRRLHDHIYKPGSKADRNRVNRYLAVPEPNEVFPFKPYPMLEVHSPGAGKPPPDLAGIWPYPGLRTREYLPRRACRLQFDLRCYTGTLPFGCYSILTETVSEECTPRSVAC